MPPEVLESIPLDQTSIAKPIDDKPLASVPLSSTKPAADPNEIISTDSTKNVLSESVPIDETDSFDVDLQRDTLRTMANTDEPRLTAVKGFKGTGPRLADNIFADQTSLQDTASEGLVGKLYNLAIKGRDGVDQERITKVHDFFADFESPLLEELDELENRDDAESNPEIAARIKELDSQYNDLQIDKKRQLAGEADPDLDNEFNAETINQIMTALGEDPGAVGGEFVNAFISDPQYFLVPLGWRSGAAMLASRVKRLQGVAKVVGGATGAATLGAALEAGTEAGKQLADQGKITDTKKIKEGAKLGAAGGVVVGGAFIGGANVLRALPKAINKVAGQSSAASKTIVKKIKEGKTINDIADEIVEPKAGSVRTKAKEDFDVIDFSAAKARVSTAGAQQVTSKLDNIVELAVPRIVRVLGKKTAESFMKAGKSFGRALDDIATPISTRMQDIDPKVANRMNRMELRRGVEANKLRARMEPFIKSVKKLDDNEFKTLDLHLKNGRFDEATKIIRSLKNGDEAVKQFDEAQKVFSELLDRAKKAGIEITELKNYWARAINDIDGFRDFIGEQKATQFQKAVREKEAKLNRPLSKDEQSDLLVNSLRTFTRDGLSAPQATKARSVDEVTVEINNFYKTFDKTAFDYIDRIVDNIETKRFFGKASTGKDVDATSAIHKMIDEGSVPFEKQAEFINLLKGRFVDGVKPVNRLVSGSKNILYSILIGNPLSAATQIGDLGFALYRNGLIRGVQGAITPKKITIKDLGIDKIAQEFSDSRRTAKFVDRVFKLSGFQQVDKFGKESLVNGAVRKAQASVKSPKRADKFRADQVDTFGDEVDDLIDALQKGDFQNENVKLYAWNQLTKSQPISLSEMPARYLKHPNGRIAYMLKTFTIKQVDLIRREILREIVRNPKKGLRNLIAYSTYFTGLSMTSDAVKDLMMGRDIDMSDAVMVNFWRNLGLSKFLVNQAVKDGPVEAMVNFVITPISVTKDIGEDVWNDVNNLIDEKVDAPEDLKTLKRVPVFGKLWSELAKSNED